MDRVVAQAQPQQDAEAEPGRSWFAQVVADAYASQYGPDPDPVMGLPAIDYDTDDGTFSWGSDMNDPTGSEVRVAIIEEGIFGDPGETAEEIRAAIRVYLMDPASDDYWDGVLSIIAEAQS